VASWSRDLHRRHAGVRAPTGRRVVSGWQLEDRQHNLKCRTHSTGVASKRQYHVRAPAPGERNKPGFTVDRCAGRWEKEPSRARRPPPRPSLPARIWQLRPLHPARNGYFLRLVRRLGHLRPIFRTNDCFVYIRPGTTLAYSLTDLGLDARMIVCEENRTIRRNRDTLASVTPEPCDTPGSCTSWGAAGMSGADVFGASVFGSALHDVPFVRIDHEFRPWRSAGVGNRARSAVQSPWREVAVPPSSITGMLKA
jgi:hypothetical protein